jgi:hypothetical protein
MVGRRKVHSNVLAQRRTTDGDYAPQAWGYNYHRVA